MLAKRSRYGKIVEVIGLCVGCRSARAYTDTPKRSSNPSSIGLSRLAGASAPSSTNPQLPRPNGVVVVTARARPRPRLTRPPTAPARRSPRYWPRLRYHQLPTMLVYAQRQRGREMHADRTDQDTLPHHPQAFPVPHREPIACQRPAPAVRRQQPQPLPEVSRP